MLIDLEKKEVDFNMRVKYELIFQEKWLEKKLEVRNRHRSSHSSSAGCLKANETKTSLRSQPNRQK